MRRLAAVVVALLVSCGGDDQVDSVDQAQTVVHDVNADDCPVRTGTQYQCTATAWLVPKFANDPTVCRTAGPGLNVYQTNGVWVTRYRYTSASYGVLAYAQNEANNAVPPANWDRANCVESDDRGNMSGTFGMGPIKITTCTP